MKRTFTVVLIFFLVATIETAFAQQSVLDSKEYAEKLLGKVKSRNFKKFNESYEQALKDIAEIEANAPTTEFGYDAMADNMPDWIELNNILKKFDGGKITLKEETITFQIKDYSPLLTETKSKAAKGHFDAAVKIIESNTDFNTRLDEAFGNFVKAKSYSSEFNDKITEYRAQVYYEEGARILKTGTSFDEKVKCETYFTNALKEISDYKDIKDLMAAFYYSEGVKLITSTKIDDVSNAITYITNAGKYIENYKESATKIELAKQNGAKILYNEGLTKEKEKTFEAQLKAIEFYNSANKWVEGYKDATAKAEAIEKRIKVEVYVCNEDGQIISPTTFDYNLQSKTNSYIITPTAPEALSTFHMRDPMFYKDARKAMGHGFILIAPGAGQKGYTYKVEDPKVTTETVKKYYQVDIEAVSKKETSKEITEKEYKTAKTILDLSGKKPDELLMRLEVYEGTVTTTVSKASFNGDFAVDIIDFRNPTTIKTIKTIPYTNSYSDTKTKTTYSGSPKAQPNYLKNDKEALMTEAEFYEYVKSYPVSCEIIVKRNYDIIAEYLNKDLVYIP